jgi:tetratricopeptide (TPR) repeat protein
MFIDSPSPEILTKTIAGWPLPDLPAGLDRLISGTGRRKYAELSRVIREKMMSSPGQQGAARLEKAVIDWLYDFIRLNIKRGPVFDLRQVLRTGSADCLGYGKLFTTLGRLCGLNTGIVEVVVDNRGQSVPHIAILVKPAVGKPRFIDLWYGSTDIRHKRLGLQVKRNARWQVEDVDFREIQEAEEISYLTDACADGITCYIQGNRALKEGEYNRAAEKYTEAIKLYPENARPYYNRGIVYERLHQPDKAQADYARAMQDEASLRRILAVQPQDVVDLMQLDQRFIPDLDQQIYLMHAGFFSGRRIAPAQIAKKLDIPVDEVEAVLAMMRKVSRKLNIDYN